MEAVLILLPLAVAALLVWLLGFSARRYWAVVGHGRAHLGRPVFFVGPLVCAALVVHLVKRIP